MKISVALCTFNGEKYLSEQLESILRQDRSVDEVIICDDGSTDKTVAIIKQALCSNPSIIHYFQNETGLGSVKNFEKAIATCTGDIIFLADQDDVWLPEKVKKLCNIFENDPSVKLVFTNGALIDENGISLHQTLWERWGFDTAIQKAWIDNKTAFEDLKNNHNRITGATVAFRSELKEFMFPFDLPHLYYHDAWLGLLAAGSNGLRYINDTLINYRVHAAQQVGVGNGKAISETLITKSHISYQKFHRAIDKKFPHYKSPEKSVSGFDLLRSIYQRLIKN